MTSTPRTSRNRRVIASSLDDIARSRSTSYSRRDSAHGAGKSVSAAQAGQSGEVRDVIRRLTGCRGVRAGAPDRPEARAAAAYVRHHHYRRHLLHRVHPGKVTRYGGTRCRHRQTCANKPTRLTRRRLSRNG